MKKQKLWTRLAAGLGVAVLVLCQNGITPVRAAEGETEILSVFPAYGLFWGEDGGSVHYSVPYEYDFDLSAAENAAREEGGYEYWICIYCDGNLVKECNSGNHFFGGSATERFFEDSGTYTFRVETQGYVDGKWEVLAVSELSPEFEYIAAAAIQKEEPKGWEPTTPDEIRRYTACGSEEVKYTADEKNVYPVTVQNSVQGEKCFDSFDAVLGEYVIGKTYNIFPSGEPTYQMDSKARITLNIPESLQADGRTFRMICVTENGRPVVLEDMDSNSETITFETDTYYAFALVYKDAETSK